MRLRSTLNNTGQTLTLDTNTGNWALEGGTISGGVLDYADVVAPADRRVSSAGSTSRAVA